MISKVNQELIKKIGSNLQNRVCLRGYSSKKFDPNHKTEAEIKYEVEEIKIKLPFGHITGKWWGNKNIQPIITFHGWQGE